ncbi:MAG: glycosyltransferase family 4 protein [Gemmatimonadota bacterium]|nr:glycosyltransferase family 4 protein [Gemmatimonadota bacterium]
MSRSIVHVLAPAAFGGLESVVLTLAAGQAARGDRVTVVASFTEPPEGQPFWDALLEVEDVRAVPLVLGARQYLAERRAVRNALAEARADVMHTHGYRPDVVDAPVGRAAGVPTVTTVHGFTALEGFTARSFKGRLYEWLQRRAYRRFDAVVAVSAKLERELLGVGVPQGALHCLPNAWAPASPFLARDEAREVLGLPDGAPVVGWIGRMSPEKAPDVALGAFGELGGGEARLSFVGNGRLRPSLEARAAEEGLAERIHWHGVVPGAGRYMKAFDALLISSWTEGTPIVLLEAMAAGVPVVTTAVGGIPDVVSDTEAVLVEPGDAAAMARALEPVLAGAPEASGRAEAARDRLARDYAVAPWVRRYDDIYRTCIRE